MMQRFAIGAAVVLGFVATCGVRADEPKEPNYYPLKKGNTWTYKIQGGPNTILVRVVNLEKDGALLETVVEEMVVPERIQVKEDGVYRTEVKMMKLDAPIKILKLPVKAGDSWEINNESVKGKFSVRAEEVKVPDGKYKALVVEGKDFEINGRKMNLSTWYVDKVGIVKISSSLDGVEFVLELEKFVEGK
jgi:hypothetical protein